VAHTSSELPRQIANAHTIFNVVVSLIVFPFVRPIANLVKMLVPARPEKEKTKVTIYIDEAQLAVPSVALKKLPANWCGLDRSLLKWWS